MHALPVAILAMDNAEDEAFMEKLYINNRRIMYKIAYKVLENHQDTEDVINDACLALIKKIELLRTFDSCTLRSYIVSTIRNTAVNYAVRRNRNGKYCFLSDDEAVFESAEQESAVDAHAIQEAELGQLEAALEKLPTRERDILRMKYLNQMSDAEIAAVFGIKPNSVRYYLTQARRRAMNILKEAASK